MTLAACLQEAIHTLTSAGFSRDDAARDAGVIGRAIVGWDAARWISRQREDIPPGLLPAFQDHVGRRAGGEPVAYIVGEREFFGRLFYVTPAVLIPRPDTELVIETALDHVGDALVSDHAPAVLDVGTGSGCLAVTLACEWPAATISATDTSRAALDVALRNARRHGVDQRITWRETALCGDLADALDLIVANPPYVPESDRESLSRDVRDYEPHEALFGGPDGLDVIRTLLPAAANALRRGGLLIMEIGYGQADRVQALLADAGLEWIDTRPDLAGIPRVIVARRPRLV